MLHTNFLKFKLTDSLNYLNLLRYILLSIIIYLSFIGLGFIPSLLQTPNH
jgi:hypothetical protein